MSATPHPLGVLLQELGWRPEHLARQLNDFAAAQGRPERVHLKTPYKWLAGDLPRSPWPALIPALLTGELHRPVTCVELGWPEQSLHLVPACAGLILPWSAAGGLQATQIVTDAVPMQRRMFLTLFGTAMTSPAHEWLIAAQVGDSGHTSGTHLPVEVVDHLDSITDNLRRMDDHLGGAQTLDLVRQHLATVVDLLEHRRYSDTTGRRLHATAAELLRLAGWLSFDDSTHPQAQRFWIAALHEAHAAGDRALGANILGFMSCQAKDLGQIREAVTLAETARAGYPAASPRVSAILDLRAAEAYANEQSTTDCRRALDTAFARLDDPAAQHGDPAWCYWVNHAQAHAQAGYCYVRLEDWSRARQHLRSALRLQGNEFTREGALRNALLATTYVRQAQPDLDQALHLGDRAVATLSDQVRSARCVKHVNRLVATLAPYRRNHAVRHFTDNAKALLGATTTS